MPWNLSGQRDRERSKIFCNTIIPPKSLKDVPIVPKVTIIVVTTDSTKSITDTLDSIAHLDYPLNSLELLVVDGLETEHVEKEISEFTQEQKETISTRHIRNDRGHGFGKGINLGTHLASPDARYLLVLKSDRRLFNDTLNHLVSSALSTEEFGFRLWECRQVPREHPKVYNPVTLETSWSSAACCLIDNTALKEIGGFDERFSSYLEEVDLSWRFRVAGYRLRYVPKARVAHAYSGDPDSSDITLNNNSVIDGFYLRYKYGSFFDNMRYRKQFWSLFFVLPENSNIKRKHLILLYLKHFRAIPYLFAFRVKNREKLHFFTPFLRNFDFALHRLQAPESSYPGEGYERPLPKVSIIVRTIGKSGFLREALTSIRNQTYPHIEVVVVEDGPATLQDMIQSEFSDLDLKYFPLGENHGRCYAGNYGMKMSTGKYLRFLDEDDLLFADSVERAVSFIVRNAERTRLVYDLAYVAPTDVLSEKPFKYREYEYYVYNNENYRQATLFSRNTFPIQCALFDRYLMEECGGFDENLDALEDWDLWIRYSMKTDFFMVPQVTSLFRVPYDPDAQQKRRDYFEHFRSLVRQKYRGGYCTMTYSDMVSEYQLTSSSRFPLSDWRRHYVNIAMRERLDAFLSTPHAKMSFPAYDAPKVSIIVQAWNNSGYTFHCLENILAHADIPYELILVGNTEDGVTGSLLEKIEGITVHHIPAVKGSMEGYTVAAGMARGKYLLFLANDALVPLDWLSGMVRTLETIPRCGAVGCKIVSHGGSLQEAGGIVWADGSVSRYGENGNPDDFPYNYLRPVDYCSRSCLLTLKEVFLELGGFSPDYHSGLYEDIDYCMKVRTRGYSVYYQPLVTIFTHELLSHDHARAASQADCEKFVTRWASQLKDHYDAADNTSLLARERREGKRVLVIDRGIPLPAHGVGFPRADRICREIAENGYIMTFFPLDFRYAYQPITREFQQRGIEVVYDYKGNLDDFFTGRYLPYDLVIISRPDVFSKTFEVIKKYLPGVPILYDAEALYSIRTILKLQTQGILVDRKKHYECMKNEIDLLNKADSIIVVSDREKEIAIENGLEKPVYTLGYSIETRDPVPGFDDRKDILFVGSFLVENGPNTDAVLYFIKSLFPGIAHELNCTFHIVGYKSLPSLSSLRSKDILIHGRVDNISEYYDRCRIFIVPHQYAAGIPIKLSEAMSHGVPAVVSKIIADQFSLTDRKEVLIAASDEEFINSVIHLYQDRDLWTHIQKEGYDFIKRTHDPLQFKEKIAEIMEKTLKKS